MAKMTTICAECGQTISYRELPGQTQAIVSHGLCSRCAVVTLHRAGIKTELEEAVDKLGRMLEEEELRFNEMRKAFEIVEHQILGIKGIK